MSIASELNNYRNGLDDAWDAAEDMGATIPHDRNMVNLDDAIRTIPVSSPNDGVLTITQNGVTIQTFSADQATNVTAALTDTTYSNFTGATSSVAGAAGLVPAPTTSDPDKYLKGDGSWGTPTDTTYTAGTNVSISAQNVISATDTTYSNFTGATSSVAGAAGLVPAPSAGDEGKALHGDGTWKDTTAKLVEMSYGESNAWAKFIAAYNAGSIVYCRASSNSNPASGSQTRKAFMAYVNNAASPTNVEFQYVRSVSSKTDSQQCDQVFVYTLTNASGGTWSVASRNMAPKINVSGPITKTFSNGANATVTIGADAMTGATSSADGAAGIVPKPVTGDNVKVLKGDGTWGKVVNDNIDWSTVPSSYTECTTTGSAHPPTAGNCKISKIGKIVNLQVNYSYSGGNVFDLASFGDVIIADIPDGYRPPFHIYGAAMLKFTSSTVSGSLINTVHLWASSSGYLLINNMDAGAITGITSIRGNLTWFVA